MRKRESVSDPWSDQRKMLIQLYLKSEVPIVPPLRCVPAVQPLRSILVGSRNLTRGSERLVKFLVLQTFVWMMCHVQFFCLPRRTSTKVSDISDSKCRGLRGEFASSKGQPPGGVPTDLKGEFFASFGLLAIKSSLLRALRVLRGENFFTAKPEEAIFLVGLSFGPLGPPKSLRIFFSVPLSLVIHAIAPRSPSGRPPPTRKAWQRRGWHRGDGANRNRCRQ